MSAVKLINDPAYDHFDWGILVKIKFCPCCGKRAYSLQIAWTQKRKEANLFVTIFHSKNDLSPCKLY
jgi:hypothetical protein